jgi:error-prone DNA polymerase
MYSLMTLEEEARRLGVETLPPDVSISGIRYDLERTTSGDLAIRKPLLSIAELTADDARAIVMARMERPFESVEDLYRRVPIERTALDLIARSGALDRLAGSSRRALWEIGVLARRLGPAGSGKRTMLIDLPAIAEEDIPTLPELTPGERLRWDYLTHGAARYHPMILLRRTLNDLEIRRIITCFRFTASKLRPRSSPNPIVTVAGLAVLRQMPPTAKGVMFITLEDESGFIQCIVLPEVQAALPPVLRSPALIVRGSLRIVGEWRGLMVTDAWALEGTIGGYSGYPSAYGGTDRLVTGSSVGESQESRSLEVEKDSSPQRHSPLPTRSARRPPPSTGEGDRRERERKV